MLLYLTINEIKVITGRVKASAQIKWLRSHGFTVLPRADGKHLVSRTHFEAKMNGYLPGIGTKPIEPDYSSLK